MSSAEVKTSSAYLLFYQRRGVGDAVREDLASGSHWIYKLFPYKSRPNLVQITAPLASEFDTLDEAHKPDNRTEKETDYDEFVSPSVRQDRTDIAVCEKDLIDFDEADERVRMDQGLYANGIQRPTLYDRQLNSNRTGNKTLVNGPSRNSDTVKRSESKLTERGRDPTKRNVANDSYGSGLKVKLPENEAFIVRQNNVTGQTVVQRYDGNAYQGDGRNSTVSSEQSSKSHNSAISNIRQPDVPQKNTNLLQQGVYKVNNPRLYTDGEDTVDAPTLRTFKDARASFRGDIISANNRESKADSTKVKTAVTSVQGRGQIAPATSQVAKSAWSTPQLQRKTSSEPPTPPVFNRQMSQPTRPGLNFDPVSNSPSAPSIPGRTDDVSRVHPKQQSGRIGRPEENGHPPRQATHNGKIGKPVENGLPPRHPVQSGNFKRQDDGGFSEWPSSQGGKSWRTEENGIPSRPQSFVHKRSKSQPRYHDVEQNLENERRHAGEKMK